MYRWPRTCAEAAVTKPAFASLHLRETCKKPLSRVQELSDNQYHPSTLDGWLMGGFELCGFTIAATSEVGRFSHFDPGTSHPLSYEKGNYGA